MPATPHATAHQTRRPIRSRRKSQLSSATAAGIAAMMTPAASALVRLTPNNMKMENRKLPRNDSRKSRRRIRPLMGNSSAGFLSHDNIAMPPMPKRSQASKNTGNAATSDLDRAT